jgi:hypothetical protein
MALELLMKSATVTICSRTAASTLPDWRPARSRHMSSSTRARAHIDAIAACSDAASGSITRSVCS